MSAEIVRHAFGREADLMSLESRRLAAMMWLEYALDADSGCEAPESAMDCVCVAHLLLQGPSETQEMPPDPDARGWKWAVGKHTEHMRECEDEGIW